ncbi:MAG: FecR family protein [Treponema sp.]
MKRIAIILTFLLITTSIFAVSGEVIAIKGKVEVQKDGQWKLAQKGETLDSGVLISTGFKSELTMKVDGSTIIVQPLTRLRLDEIVKKGDVLSSKVYLDMGSIKANVKPAETKKVSFTVRTPVATASVRGTSGEISYNGILNGETGIWDYINPSGDIVKVFAGDTVSIDNFGNIKPAQITFAQEVKPQTPTTMADKDTIHVGVDEQKYNKGFDENQKIVDVIVNVDWE